MEALTTTSSKKNKSDLQGRSTLRAWINYMVANPAYFWQATGLRHTNANIGRIALELFDGDVRLFRSRTKHYHPSKVIKGLSVIGAHIGVGGGTIKNHYSRQRRLGRKPGEWKIPVWKEHGEYMAHKGRLVNWAKHKKIGNYAKGTAQA